MSEIVLLENSYTSLMKYYFISTIAIQKTSIIATSKQTANTANLSLLKLPNTVVTVVLSQKATAKTAVLVKVLHEAGNKLRISGSSRLNSQRFWPKQLLLK